MKQTEKPSADYIQPSDSGSGGQLRLAKNTFLLVVSAVAVAAVNLLISLMIGRNLGASALGIYAFATNAARIFYTGTEMGVDIHLKRVFSRHPDQAVGNANLFVTFRLLVIPVVVALAVLMSMAMSIWQVMPVIFIAMALGLSEVSRIHEDLFIARGDIGSVGLNRALYAASIAGGFVVWYISGGGLTGISLIILFAWCVCLGAYWLLGKVRCGFWPSWRWNTGQLISNLATAFPIGLSKWLAIATTRSPVLLLSVFVSTTLIGQYAAVEMFIVGMTLLQTAISNISFPILSRSYGKDPSKFRRVLLGSNAILVLLGVGFAICFTAWGGDIVRLVFPGRDFAGLDAVAALLGWAAPVVLLVQHNIYVFTAANLEGKYTLVTFVGLVAVAFSVLVLVPLYGLYGAAMGVIIGRVIGCVIIAIAFFRLKILHGGATASER